eukprot:ANDGO_07948.mRNA.1 hypothetical protein
MEGSVLYGIIVLNAQTGSLLAYRSFSQGYGLPAVCVSQDDDLDATSLASLFYAIQCQASELAPVVRKPKPPAFAQPRTPSSSSDSPFSRSSLTPASFKRTAIVGSKSSSLDNHNSNPSGNNGCSKNKNNDNDGGNGGNDAVSDSSGNSLANRLTRFVARDVTIVFSHGLPRIPVTVSVIANSVSCNDLFTTRLAELVLDDYAKQFVEQDSKSDDGEWTVKPFGKKQRKRFHALVDGCLVTAFQQAVEHIMEDALSPKWSILVESLQFADKLRQPCEELVLMRSIVSPPMHPAKVRCAAEERDAGPKSTGFMSVHPTSSKPSPAHPIDQGGGTSKREVERSSKRRDKELERAFQKSSAIAGVHRQAAADPGQFPLLLVLGKPPCGLLKKNVQDWVFSMLGLVTALYQPMLVHLVSSAGMSTFAQEIDSEQDRSGGAPHLLHMTLSDANHVLGIVIRNLVVVCGVECPRTAVDRCASALQRVALRPHNLSSLVDFMSSLQLTIHSAYF